MRSWSTAPAKYFDNAALTGAMLSMLYFPTFSRSLFGYCLAKLPAASINELLYSGSDSLGVVSTVISSLSSSCPLPSDFPGPATPVLLREVRQDTALMELYESMLIL